MSFRHPGKAEHARRLLDCPPGDCFRQAFWWCESYASATRGTVRLVHGFPAFQAPGENYGKPFAHAWVEVTTTETWPDGTRLPVITVVDPSVGGIADPRRVPLGVYYAVGGIERHAPPRRYNGAQAVALLIEHEHYGGWEPYPTGVLCRDRDTGEIVEAE